MEFSACKFFAIFMAVLLIQCGVTVTAHNKNKTQAKSGAVSALFVFGDSIVDTGNNNVIPTAVRANFPPYGKNFPGHRATGRWGDGRVTPDFISSNLGLKEYIPPYLGAKLTTQDLLTVVVFASAASGYDVFTSGIVHVLSMKKQLEMFQEYKQKVTSLVGEKKANNVVSNAMFIVCAGSNDVHQFNHNPRALAMGWQRYSEELKNLAIQYVRDLYGLGARSFVVTGIGPVGCVPYFRTIAGGPFRRCAEDMNDIAKSFNTKIVAEIQSLQTSDELPGSKILFNDVYPQLIELITYPEKYGFKETTRGCCGTGLLEAAALCNIMTGSCENPSEYVFWDSYHPSERASKIMVDMFKM